MALEPITRQEKIIAGQDLTPITRMEKFLKQYGGGPGGVTSWNELEDKPFVTVGGDTLEWDGNTEGLVSVDMEDGAYFCKVSDATPTIADFANGFMATVNIGGEVIPQEIPGDQIESFDGLVVSAPWVAVVSEAGFTMDELVFPETGTYLLAAPADGMFVSAITIPGYTGFTKEQIDPKALPDTVRLYLGMDKYLYKTTNAADASNRITKDELRSLVLSNKTFVLYMYVAFTDGRTVEAFSFPATVDFDSANPYGSVGVVTTDGFTTYYTAEYTAS